MAVKKTVAENKKRKIKNGSEGELMKRDINCVFLT